MEGKRRYVTALSIGGFDGSAGAGIQADLKTFAALGCYGLSALTALPVQNTQGVQNIYPMTASSVREQLHAIFEDCGPEVIKIGMLHRSEIVHTVADILEKYPHLPVVVDPVMCSKNGVELLQPQAIACLQNRLFPLATILTPNLAEASRLVQAELTTPKQMELAAQALLRQGVRAVVIKGGHLLQPQQSCADCLCVGLAPQDMHWLCQPRQETVNTHGTGCTFAAAIASFLANGVELTQAVVLAKAYITNCIEAGACYALGAGHGPLHHFFALWPPKH